MRKIILAVTLAAALGGCAQLSTLTNGISLVTKSTINPVTQSDEAKIEVAVDGAIKLLLAYKQACINGSADKNCKANIAEIQAYTKQIPPLVAQLRGFVDNNNQINAAVVYNQLIALYTNAKNIAANFGVTLGSVS